nr:MAG TPA: hypothetical protein [Caudoviricetes sp.]
MGGAKAQATGRPPQLGGAELGRSLDRDPGHLPKAPAGLHSLRMTAYT